MESKNVESKGMRVNMNKTKVVVVVVTVVGSIGNVL